MNNAFGIEFPPHIQRWTAVFPAGSQSNITTSKTILGTFPAPKPGYYLVNWEGAMTRASGMANNNIHFIVSQNTNPTANSLSQFAFQSIPEFNNGTTILASSMTDALVITDSTPVSVFLYDTQAGGSVDFDFVWEAVKITPIKYHA
jgi:hypothetical protein